jgi:hypothetical protein
VAITSLGLPCPQIVLLKNKDRLSVLKINSELRSPPFIELGTGSLSIHIKKKKKKKKKPARTTL